MTAVQVASSRAISPLDGRYRAKTERLSEYFSEFALMRMRCAVELDYLAALASTGLFPPLSDRERAVIELARTSFSQADFDRIKEIESSINHDVKACEIHLRERLDLANPNLLHFALTSEDVNNLAYSRLLRDFVAREQLPLLTQLIAALCAKVKAWRDIAFPARTHGQKASPSTLGKEMAVFADRLLRQRGELAAFRFRGKITGATGTWAAWRAAFPGHDWPAFSWILVSAMGLEPAMVTTQVEDHDTWASYFALAGRVNGIVRDLDVDVWLYQTLGYLGEQAKADEVGSSTMPHKVNPIRFENSEGNLHVADALLDMMRRELTHSRLQRDLSDSTVTRNIGVALAHSLLAWQETLAGLARLEPRPRRCEEDLRDSPELLTEPIQTILRAEGVPDAYDLVRRFSRGRPLTGEDLAAFVQSLPVSAEAKDRIFALRVNEYTGYAGEICDRVLAAASANLGTELIP